MKTMRLGLAAAGAFAMTAMCVAGAGAQCLSAAGWKAAAKPAAWTATNSGARLVRAAYHPAQQDITDLFSPIVGMWHVKLVATSAQGAPVPVGAEIDAGYQQWHSDGTEMLNSARPAANTNFCMGVWQQVGPRTFKLNHFAISYTQGPPQNAESGPTNIRTGPTTITETVTVSADGNSYKGTFTITDYAETDPMNGSPNTLLMLDTISGTLTGTRIDVNTPVSPIF